MDLSIHISKVLIPYIQFESVKAGLLHCGRGCFGFKLNSPADRILLIWRRRLPPASHFKRLTSFNFRIDSLWPGSNHYKTSLNGIQKKPTKRNSRYCYGAEEATLSQHSGSYHPTVSGRSQIPLIIRLTAISSRAVQHVVYYGS